MAGLGIDWFRVLMDLRYAGMSERDVAGRIGVAASTVRGWKMGSAPSHEDGERLVMLWRAVTGKARDELPLCLGGKRRR